MLCGPCGVGPQPWLLVTWVEGGVLSPAETWRPPAKRLPEGSRPLVDRGGAGQGDRAPGSRTTVQGASRLSFLLCPQP